MGFSDIVGGAAARFSNAFGGRLPGQGEAGSKDSYWDTALPGVTAQQDFSLPGPSMPSGPGFALPGQMGPRQDFSLPGASYATSRPFSLPGAYNPAQGFALPGGSYVAPDIMDKWLSSVTSMQQQAAAQAAAAAQGGQNGYPVSPTAGSGGKYDSPDGRDLFEMYRPWIVQYAAENQIDPDALAAMLWIETDGGTKGATAVSPAGAQGLGQIMPGTWTGVADPGDSPFNPQHSIKNAARYFASQYRTYGSYALAAAAYLGGGGGVVNGAPNPNNFDGNMSSAQYAALFEQNLRTIKSSAPPVPTGGTAAGINSIFGGRAFPISQGFGHTPFSTGEGADVYDFGTSFGLDGDEHSGWDIASPDGTQFYMPQGLTGKVAIAGCTQQGCYYTDDRGTGAGRGELRIVLSNGYELIFGHNSGINVQVGDTVTGGMLLGTTGRANGAHLHVEVRVPDPSMPGGFRIVDPSILFGTPGGGGGAQR